MRNRISAIAAFALLGGIFGAPSTPAQDAVAPAASPLGSGVFVENAGQWRTTARFHSESAGLAANFHDDEVQLLLNGRVDAETAPGVLVALRFCGREAVSFLEGADRLPGHYNFFLGSDPGRWRGKVPAYRGLRYRELWDGIDLIVRRVTSGELAYDLVLAPGADVGEVEIQCLGMENLRVRDDGALELATAAGPLAHIAPVTWEELPGGELRQLGARFVLRGEDRYGFEVERAPDPDCTLVIDPTVDWASYLGADQVEWARGLTVGSSDEPVAAGASSAPLADVFPTTPGVFQELHSPVTLLGADAFVARFSAAGDALVYCTLFGGSSEEEAQFVAVHLPTQEVVVAGYTGSSDMPVTPGAFDTTHNNPGTIDYSLRRDIFVARFAADGSQLVYSTYIGGTDKEKPWTMALTAGGDVVLGGHTGSADFPTTPLAFDTSFNGATCGGFYPDAFVTRLSADGGSLVYSTYLGGSGYEIVNGLRLDSTESVYLCGKTTSPDFPVTAGAFDTVRDTINCGSTGFVAKMDSSGSALVASTYVDATSGLTLFDLTLDASGRVIVGGSTINPGFPTTPGAFQETHQGDGDAFLVRFDATLSSIDYASYFGGVSGYEAIISVDRLSTGEVVVGGFTASADLPTTPDALDTSYAGSSPLSPQDGWLAILDLEESGADALVYSTFLGGNSSDELLRLCVDGEDRVLISLETGSSSLQGPLPVTPGTFDPEGPLSTLPDSYFLRLRVRESEFRRGDINADGFVNIADAISLLAKLFGTTGGPLSCRDAADTNDDGGNDIADAIFVLATLFSQGAPPPAPGTTTCGDDPTSDSLDCAQNSACP